MKFSSIITTLQKSTSTPDLEQVSRSGAFSLDSSKELSPLVDKGVEFHFEKLFDLNDAPDEPANLKSFDRDSSTLVPAPLIPMDAPHYDFKLHTNNSSSVANDTKDSETVLLDPEHNVALYQDLALEKLNEEQSTNNPLFQNEEDLFLNPQEQSNPDVSYATNAHHPADPHDAIGASLALYNNYNLL